VGQDETIYKQDLIPSDCCMEHSKITILEKFHKIKQQIIDQNLKIYNDRIKDLRDGITPGDYNMTVNAIKRLDLYYILDQISEESKT
jgi:hypothetical protein